MDSIFYFYMLNASNYIFTKKKKIKLEKFSSLFFSKFIFLTSLVTCSRKDEKEVHFTGSVYVCAWGWEAEW